MFGAIIPAPLAMPPTVIVSPPAEKRAVASFGRVSVVMMARAAPAPPSQPSFSAAAAMPARTLSMGRRTPITPVEATTTSEGAHPTTRAVAAAISRASARPSSPVAALAQPALTTTARARPEARCSRETTTGAACAALVVKTAAAAHGPWATTRARSSPVALMPAAVAAAQKPAGAVMAPVSGRAAPADGFARSSATLIGGPYA